MKDYYDIYKLFKTTEFNETVLQEAIKTTFLNRGTMFQMGVLNNKEYITNPLTERMWNNMKTKRGIKEELSFKNCVTYINSKLEPIMNNLIKK